MVLESSYLEMTKEELNRLISERKNMQNMYGSETGQEQLFKMIDGALIFEKLDSKSAEEIGARNFVIDILTNLGFCDENNVKKYIKYMIKEMEIVPRSALDRL